MNRVNEIEMRHKIHKCLILLCYFITPLWAINSDALVRAGANVNLGDRSRTSPLQLARARGYREMVQIMEQAGAK